MKKNKNVPFYRGQTPNLFLFLLLFCFCIGASAQQTYLKQWMYVPKRLTFPASGAPTVTNTPTSLTNGQNGNGIYKANGNIHFYVYGNKVYDSAGTAIFTLPFNASINESEIAIVPFNKATCANQYYIFYTLFNNWGSSGCTGCRAIMYGAIVSTDLLTGAMSVKNITYPNDTARKRLAVSTSVYPNDGNAGIAVSKAIGTTFTDYGKRFVYFVSGGSVQRMTLVEPTSTNNYTGIDTTVTVIDSSSLAVNYATREADLSPDGTMLAWGEFYYSSTGGASIDSNRYNVVYLNPTTGTYTGQSKKISAPTADISISSYFARGVEFSSDNQYLFVNTGTSGTNTSKDGIYKVQLSNGSKTYLSGSNSCNNSLLEMGGNGMLYVAKGDSLKAINPGTFAFQSAYDVAASAQVIHYGSFLSYRALPDQIDGENYDPYLYQKYEVTNGIYDVTTNETWTPATWGRNVIRFPAGIKIHSGAGIFIQDMKVEFGSNTSLEIQPGGYLQVRQSILSGYRNLCAGDTAYMWKGITASSSTAASPIYIDLATSVDTSFKTSVMDALVGCKTSGKNVQFSAGGVLFTGNVVDLRFDTMVLKTTGVGNSKISITGCRFIDDQPLVDQTKGIADGYGDGLKRTITSIVLNMIDSAFAVLSYDTLQGGQYGVVSTKSKFKLQYSVLKFHNVLSTSLSGTKDSVELSNIYYNNSKNGLSITDSKAGANIRVLGTQSRFTVMNGFAINCQRNTRMILQINGVNFDHCGSAPINLYSNRDWNRLSPTLGNDIRITGNWFDNIPDSKAAIVVTEPASATRSYLRFQVNGNTIGQTAGIQTGIELNNVIGGNPIKVGLSGDIGPVKKDYLGNQYPICEVNSNIITLYETVGWRKGIAANASSQMTFYDNNLNAQVGSNYYWTTGIHITDAMGSLILGNAFGFKGRSGLEANGNMMYSNYDCNTFYDCGVGVLLTGKHILRNYAQNHGIVTTDARNNTFNTPTWGRGILYDYYATSLNQWVFKTGAPLPKIRTIPGSGSIVAGYGTDNCATVLPPAPPSGTFAAIDTLTDPILNFFDQYYKHRAYLDGNATSPSSNTDIVKIIQAEDSIANGQFSGAQSVLNTVGSSSTITTDYKKVYLVYVSGRIADTALTNAQVNSLDSIAKKNSINQSPAAICARGILWNERQLRYADSADFIYPDLTGYIDSACATRTNVRISLLNLSGTAVAETYTDSTGRFLFDATTVALYDNGQSYRLKASIPGFPDQYTSYANILDLSYLSDIIFSCGFAKTGTTTGLVDKQQTTNGVKVYPNPAHEFIVIQSTSATNHVRICNIIGEAVYEGNMYQEARIDTHNWQKGVYFVYISDNQKIHAVEKILIH